MASLNMRIDDDLKAAADLICDNIGITTTAAVTMYLKQMVRVNGLPFEVKADPFYSAENMAALAESLTQLKNGKVVEKSLTELESMANG